MSADERLPAGWCRTTVGDVCDIASGYGFPTSMQGRQDGDLPFFTGRLRDDG